VLDPPLRWAAAAAGDGARIVSTSMLSGGSTGSVTALEMRDGRGRRRWLVLKVYRPDPSEPDSAWREAHILELLAATDLPVPRVEALDRDGAACGMPALLLTRMPGRRRMRPRRLRPWLADLARLAERIHTSPVPHDALPAYQAWDLDEPRPLPGWWSDPRTWPHAVEVFRGPAPHERSTFIHRDFHPGNVLWGGERVSAIVDWLHGCRGPVAVDVAHCRLNLWLDLGRNAADAWLDACGRLGSHHPYWDIVDAMSWVPDPSVDGARRARRYEEFITAALRRF
jgi:Ser/Thr protein kinase RdoA (MazF antagonist)